MWNVNVSVSGGKTQHLPAQYLKVMTCLDFLPRCWTGRFCRTFGNYFNNCFQLRVNEMKTVWYKIWVTTLDGRYIFLSDVKHSEESDLLGCYAVATGKELPPFRCLMLSSTPLRTSNIAERTLLYEQILRFLVISFTELQSVAGLLHVVLMVVLNPSSVL